MQDAEDNVQKRLKAYTLRDIHEPQDVFGGLDREFEKKEKLGPGGNTSVPMFIVYTLPNANHIPLRREQKRISTR